MPVELIVSGDKDLLVFGGEQLVDRDALIGGTGMRMIFSALAEVTKGWESAG